MEEGSDAVSEAMLLDVVPEAVTLDAAFVVVLRLVVAEECYTLLLPSNAASKQSKAVESKSSYVHKTRPGMKLEK